MRQTPPEDGADLVGGVLLAVSPSAENGARFEYLDTCGTPPRVLILALADDMGSERIIPAMAEAGFECGLLCPAAFASAILQSVSRHFPLPRWAGLWSSAPFVRRALERIVRDWRPDMILPLDDHAAWLLRGLAQDKRSDAATREVLDRSLGHPSGYAACVNRQAFMDLARSLDVAKPDHCDGGDIEGSLAAARRWGYPVLVKSDHTCGGVGVRLVKSEAELLGALSQVSATSLSRRLRMSLKRRIGRLSGFNVDEPDGAIVQPFVAGKLAFHTAFAWEGDILEGVSFLAQEIHPEPVGSGTVIRPIDQPQMVRSADAIAKALKYTGFFSIDFMVDEASGEALAIEFNARSIGSTHLGRLFGHDICRAAMVALGRSPADVRPMEGPYSAVALFPKEMIRAPDSPYLSAPEIYHDIPSSEPRLLDRYTRHAAQSANANSPSAAVIGEVT